MKILVTGGAGFIGSHIVDALISQEHQVTIIDNLITGREENINPNARFHNVDIRDDKVARIFEQEHFEVVYHQAAQMDVRKSVEDPRYDAEVNILGTLNLLQQCKKTDIKKFIFASTGGAIYGEQSRFPADEEHPSWPLSPYGITKLTCEKYISFFGQNYDMNYVLLRYANVYGPRQNPYGEAGVVAIFTSRMLTGEQAVINGDGKQTRDYVYVHDVVQANMKALDYPKNDYINIGTAVETDVNEIFRGINQACGNTIEEKHGPAKPGEQMRSVLAIEKAEKLLGWKPQMNIKDGLNETVAWFRDYLKKD